MLSSSRNSSRRSPSAKRPCTDFPEVRIFPGIERTLDEADMQHLLVLGTNDPAYLSMGSAPEVLAFARAHGHLTVLAHPFRTMRGAPMLEAGHLPDAIEYRTGNHGFVRGQIAERTAARLGLRLVNAGDAHRPECPDRFWIETFEPVERAEDVRSAVLSGGYEWFLQQPQPALSPR